MSYTPHTWVVGDVITAERLNALEQAVANTSSFDAELEAYRATSSSEWVFTIVSGSFASLYALLQANKTPSVLIRFTAPGDGLRAATTAVPVYTYDNGAINFYPKVPKTATSGTYSQEWTTLPYLLWTSEDTVSFA